MKGGRSFARFPGRAPGIASPAHGSEGLVPVCAPAPRSARISAPPRPPGLLQGAFSLVELLVVVAIVLILVTLFTLGKSWSSSLEKRATLSLNSFSYAGTARALKLMVSSFPNRGTGLRNRLSLQ